MRCRVAYRIMRYIEACDIYEVPLPEWMIPLRFVDIECGRFGFYYEYNPNYERLYFE